MYNNFFVENRVAELFYRNTEDDVCSFVLLRCKQLFAFLNSLFYCQTVAFVICMTDFTAKMLHVIYFVIRSEAKFC